jgi:phosphatidylglycerophosphate synthase
VSARSSKPSVAELRAATQPPSLFERNSGEHWAGRLYVRRYSPYVTRGLLRFAPNTITWLMIGVGVAAGGALAVQCRVWPAVAAFVLIQLQILFDCVDGEVARWRQMFSPSGIYLDRLGHWLTETALPIGLGIGAGEPILGLVAAVIQLLIKGESALVAVTRLEAGLSKLADRADAVAPRPSLLATARRIAARAPFYRLFVAVEFTMLTLIAAIADVRREWLWVLIALGGLTALLRLVAILTSDRLR